MQEQNKKPQTTHGSEQNEEKGIFLGYSDEVQIVNDFDEFIRLTGLTHEWFYTNSSREYFWINSCFGNSFM